MSSVEERFQEAVSLYQAGQLYAARDIAKKLLEELPGHPALLQMLGELEWRTGNNETAETLLRQGASKTPDDPLAHYRLANVLASNRLVEEAADHYKKAIQLKPDFWQALLNQGTMLLAAGKLDDARETFEKTLVLRPDLTTVHCYLLDLRLQLGELGTIAAMHDSINALVRRCIENDAERDFAALMYLAPLLSVDRQESAALAAKMDRLLAKPAAQDQTYSIDNNGKIRIGYLSPDFGDHPISHVTLGVYGRHDRSRFEVFAYSISNRSAPADIAYSQQVRDSCDTFVDLSGMTVEQAVDRIKNDGIAIMINLSGYMSLPSLEVMSWRPAPVQVYWLGHGNGLGLSFIDYVIADAIVIPDTDIDAYTESVVRLPDSYHCADTPPIPETPQSRSEHGLHEDKFVFCAFNNPNKIDSTVFDTWMNILRRVPDSLIWLSCPGDNDVLKQNLRMEAQSRGIAQDRLVFARRLADKSMHFARHRLADLFLDTYVYSASTTAIDALWSGLPVLTRPGSGFVSRICATHVNSAGLDNMVCATAQEFEDRAVFYAEHRDELAVIRKQLGDNLATCPLFDTDRFVRHLESAYTGMWERYSSGQPAGSFDVPPM